MFRRFLFLSVGALALLVVLEAPGQLHAQRMRGGSPSMRMGSPNGMRMGMRSGVMPRRGFDPRFNGNRFGFDRFGDRFGNRFGFGRFDRFEDRFGNRFGSGRFDRFEDRFERNRRFLDPFVSPGFLSGVFPF